MIKVVLSMQARSQDFSWGGGGGGGGAYLNNWDQIINIGMIRYSRSEDRTECPTYGVNEIYRDDFQSGMGKCCEHRRREPLGGSGGMPPPQKRFKSESLKTPFSAFLNQ